MTRPQKIGIAIGVCALFAWAIALVAEDKGSGNGMVGVADLIYDIGKGKHAIAEAAGFLVLTVAFAWLFKEELLRAIKEGFDFVGNKLAGSHSDAVGSFTQTVVPHLDGVMEKGFQFLRSFIVAPATPTGPPVAPDVSASLKEAEENRTNGEFAMAEGKLKRLLHQMPGQLNVIDRLVSVYLDPSYRTDSGVDGIIRALDLLEEYRYVFGNSTEFLKLLADVYMGAKDKIGITAAQSKARDAVQRCIEIEPDNPRWINKLGFVYHWFGDTKLAIEQSQQALQMVEANTIRDGDLLALIKNNLAFYYAEKRENKEDALKYSREALREFDHAEPRKRAMALDTVGYVISTFSDNRKELEEAIAMFGEALRLFPTNDSPSSHMVEAYKKLAALPN